MNALPDGVRSCNRIPKAELDLIPMLPRPRGNQRQKKSLRYYKDVILAFDIETSKTYDRQAFMYIWQLQIGHMFTICGRRWSEFLKTLRRIAEGLADNVYYVIYVHNLSHEFQFLAGIYDFQPDEVFCMDARKILRCDMLGHFEFRCSYIHSNMSLNDYTRKMGVTHLKLSGDEFDYSKLRYPWTELTPDEWEYALNDVRGLVEALEIEMQHDHDTLYTVPATSTGYVRRDVKKAMRKVNYKWLHDQLPNLHIYTLLREAFRGGNTHANRYFAGRRLYDVDSVDESSAYPTMQCNRLFPVSRFFEMPEPPSMEQLAHIINVREKAVLCRLSFWGIRLRKATWPCPYLSKDKCRNVVTGAFDNGRILAAEYLETTVTDVDLRIIMDEYTWSNVECTDCAYARYGRLPDPLVKVVEDYYKMKTELKGVEGEEIYYTKAKNKLNAVYGMSAQNPIRPNMSYSAGDFIYEDFDISRKIEDYQRRGFFPYQWGVWTTAWARAALEDGIRMADKLSDKDPRCGFVYADTDSVKYIGTIDWDAYNKKVIKASKESDAYATDPAGITHYMGVFEQEDRYAEFATRGAKKYVYRKQKDGPLGCTIAGVNKRKGGAELDRHGGIDAFLADSFTFTEAGGTESVYNDNIREVRYAEGRSFRITRNVAICDSTYTLSDTEEYYSLLQDSSVIFKYMLDKFGILW